MKYVTESLPDALAYTATHGEAEEDCKAPSSTETGAEQQSEWEQPLSRAKKQVKFVH